MKHTSVYLPDDVHKALRHEALERGVAMTELLRQIVEDYLKKAGHELVARAEPPRAGRKRVAKSPKARK